MEILRDLSAGTVFIAKLPIEERPLDAIIDTLNPISSRKFILL
jgi:hypothetical protein